MNDIAAAGGVDATDPDSYPFRTTDLLRWGDQDALGHVNNVAYARFCESGRVLYVTRALAALGEPPGHFALVHFSIDFRAEMRFPGEVRAGTRVERLGRTSIAFAQGLFKDGRCTATAKSVLVLIDPDRRKALPLSKALRRQLLAPAI